MKEIKVSPQNNTYKSKEGVLYTKDGRKLIAFPGGYLIEQYIVLNGTEQIGNHAFEGCDLLITVKLPLGVEEVGFCAFSGCSSLTNLELPSSIVLIGDSAFSFCDVLTIYAPSGSVAEAYAIENNISVKNP